MSRTPADPRRDAGGWATAGLWLRGTIDLAGDIYRGTVDIVENTHTTISERHRGLNPAADIEAPIRRLVYRQVRDIGALSFALTRAGAAPSRALAPWPTGARPADLSLHLQSALNGVCGDYLTRRGNALALDMAFVDAEGHVLDLAEAAARPQSGAGPSDHLVLLIHGLGMNDRHWQARGTDMGARLADDLGAAVWRLRYNTGQAIVDNGQALAEQLEQLWLADERPARTITLVGHSMGGLVARCALEYARAAGLGWVGCLDGLVCLGSPHRGAPLARLGHLLARGLSWSAYSRSFVSLVEARSAGIKDLRDGVAWPAGSGDEIGPTGYLPGYLLIAATLGVEDDDPLADTLGDLLVGVSSAADARSGAHGRNVALEVFPRLHHFDLLYDDAVYAHIRDWLVARQDASNHNALNNKE